MNNRILIFIVAYNAEKTIAPVLSRIPILEGDFDVEILIIDDGSQDRTFETSLVEKNREILPYKISILVNPENQGYGGNQKIGYHYAIENDFDMVVLLHSDGQYAPEMMPEIIKPILNGEADAVFGSRFLDRGGALKGGMPLYKFVGNKILSKFQNIVLRSNLSEFHSGYRAYKVDALKSLPFSLNSQEYHFDTDIIIQLLNAGRTIKEIAIPTHYGDEVCNLNGPIYAWDVFCTTSMAWLQRLSLTYQRKFDVTPVGNTKYGPKLAFDSSHTTAIEKVPAGSTVLDLGCAAGYIATMLNKKDCRVTGIDFFPCDDTSMFERFIQADLDSGEFPMSLDGVDYILMLDVIEHLNNPEFFMERLEEAVGMAPDVQLIVTTGNIAFILNRLMMLFGQFNYAERGIMDRTHKRLFTFTSLRMLFEQYGFKVEEVAGSPGPFPLVFGDNFVGRGLVTINRWLMAISKGLFSYQIYMRVKPLPSLPWLLRSAMERSEEREKKKVGAAASA